MRQPQDKPGLIPNRRAAIIAVCLTAWIAALSIRDVGSHSWHKSIWIVDLTDLLPQWLAITANLALYAYLLWLGVAFFRISQGKERLLVAGWCAAFLMAVFQNLDSMAAITIQYAKAFCYLTSFGAALFILVKTPASVNAPERLWDFRLPRVNCKQVLHRPSEPAAVIVHMKLYLKR